MITKDEQKRRVFLSEAPNDHGVLRWASNILFSLYKNSSGHKERIKYGHEFKKYVDEAIQQLPGDFELYHMRGRFRFEVASISLIKRGVASVLFGTPPTATY
uniref:Uncharacterized protein n=1 Tax=Panagrolaimus sp. PS1159 TaxID=55785 RepID=A0AC35FQ30_9BILA